MPRSIPLPDITPSRRLLERLGRVDTPTTNKPPQLARKTRTAIVGGLADRWFSSVRPQFRRERALAATRRRREAGERGDGLLRRAQFLGCQRFRPLQRRRQRGYARSGIALRDLPTLNHRAYRVRNNLGSSARGSSGRSRRLAHGHPGAAHASSEPAYGPKVGTRHSRQHPLLPAGRSAGHRRSRASLSLHPGATKTA